MARPRKKGLDYFPFDVDIYDDDKMFDLTNEFGPLGEAVFMRILCLIYRNGYYYKYQSLDKLAALIIRTIGNRWVQDKDLVMQVIPYIAECKLLSSELMRENVLTSAGIQKRYLNAAKRRLKPIIEYNLLGDGGVVSEPETGVNVTETIDNETETRINVYDNCTKQSKQNKSKQKQTKEEESKVDGEADQAAPTDTEIILSKIEDTVCPVNTRIRQDVEDWLRHMDASCICYAVDEAARSGARTTKYVYAILQRLLDDGITTGTDLANHQTRKQGKKLDFEADTAPYEKYFDEDDS